MECSTTTHADMSLLLECLRSGEPARRLGRLEGFSEKQWRRIVAMAQENRVAAILRHSLDSIGALDLLPSDARSSLDAARVGAAERNRRLFNDLGEVLAQLTARPIPVMALKGSYLAHVVYQSAGLRTMGDADLLVRRADLEPVESVLRDLGYVMREHSPGDRDRRLRSHYHVPPYVKAGGNRTKIEVHWHFHGPDDGLAMEIDAVWDRAFKSRIAGQEISVPSPEDALWHVCLHASWVHEFYGSGAGAVCDVAAIVSRDAQPVDWAMLVEIARESGIAPHVWAVLHQSRKQLGVPISSDVLEALRPRFATDAFVDRVEHAFLHNLRLRLPGSHNGRK